MERGNFFETVSAASYFLMVGFWVLLVATILLGTIQATLSEILKDLRKLQTPTPPTPPAPAPAPQPAPPADLPALSIEAMVEARAQELVRQREAARRAMVPPPVTNPPAKPATPAPRPAAPKPPTPKPNL